MSAENFEKSDLMSVEELWKEIARNSYQGSLYDMQEYDDYIEKENEFYEAAYNELIDIETKDGSIK